MKLLVDIQKDLPQFHYKVSFTADYNPLGILGGSGAGKSMTLRFIAGLDTPDRGQIVLNNKVLYDSDNNINLSARERKVGFLFQNYALFPHMTVLQNICFGLQRLTKTESLTRARQKIAVTRLEGLEDRYPHQLSGGQQQRVALARALVMEPEALLLDEPFSALDNYLRDQMEKELLEILGEYRGATLFVTHNLEEAYQVCHDLLILDHGGKIAFGSKDNIFRKPPTYSAAQITGCQNLSRARMVSGDTVKAIDWGCRLKVTQQIPADLTHVGIRAHHLVFAQNTGGNNVFPCRVSRTKESPHHMSLYLNLDSPLAEHNNYLLQIEVLKEKWEVLKQSPFPWYIRFEPSFLFLTGR